MTRRCGNELERLEANGGEVSAVRCHIVQHAHLRQRPLREEQGNVAIDDRCGELDHLVAQTEVQHDVE